MASSLADLFARDPESRAAVEALTRLPDAERTDLAALVAAWPTLPTPIKAGLLALVRSAVDTGTTR